MRLGLKSTALNLGVAALLLLSLTACATSSGVGGGTTVPSGTSTPTLPRAAAQPVSLGSAGHFAILTKTGISTVPASIVTGDIGVSPIDSTAITGFSLSVDSSNAFSTSAQVTGKVYAAEYAVPTPAYMTTAVSDMELAFTDAASRAADVTELGAGDIGGKTLIPGVYKWGTGLLIPTDITLNGSATDVWIFEIAQNLTMNSATKVILAGGALPKNIFWQVSGAVTIGTTAHLEGVVLTQTAVTMATGSSINGRLLAQTAVTLDASTVNSGADLTAPTVMSNTPLNGAIDVPLSGKISATFSTPMDAATLTASTFTLTSGTPAVPVLGAVSYANTTATFVPAASLLSNVSYTATITTSAKSASGLVLAANRTWSFTTGAGTPTVPVLLSNTPSDGATGVLLDGKVSATFSEAMDAATLTASTFTLTSGTPAVPVLGTVTYANTTAMFAPTAPLANDTLYTATITVGARSAFGVALAASRTWTFTTVGVIPTVPTVLSNLPLNGTIGVALNASTSATFSESMDPLSLTATTFTLSSGTPAVAVLGTVNYANTKATFAPTSPLASNTLYTATITTGAKSALGLALALNSAWSFTTTNPLVAGLPVNLGTAGNFVILAKSGISTVPTSAITGDLGVSPAAATYITGFSLIADATNVFSTSPQVTGKIYAADYAVPTPSNLTTAVSDMETAFTDAAGRAPTVTELGAGNIGGMTLSPGVYKWSSGVLIPTDITLTGNATDVWIFEIAQDLTLSSAAKILLAGGALPKNIFWQVSGAVMVGTTAHLEGVVLTQTAVSMATGASINGRLLAQTAVTLDGNTVVEPAL